MAFAAMLACACRNESATAKNPPQPATGASAVVDSALPLSVLMDRFRRGLDEPRGLRTDVVRRDDLVQRAVDALAEGDTLTFERLGVNRSEWAWLYYPSSPTAQPPYELPPALAWFQLQEQNRKGVFRALRELGGHRVRLAGYTCAPEPAIQGENRVWSGCVARISRNGGSPVSIRLFGAILERGGRFAILSYANDF